MQVRALIKKESEHTSYLKSFLRRYSKRHSPDFKHIRNSVFSEKVASESAFEAFLDSFYKFVSFCNNMRECPLPHLIRSQISSSRRRRLILLASLIDSNLLTHYADELISDGNYTLVMVPRMSQLFDLAFLDGVSESLRDLHRLAFLHRGKYLFSSCPFESHLDEISFHFRNEILYHQSIFSSLMCDAEDKISFGRSIKSCD